MEQSEWYVQVSGRIDRISADLDKASLKKLQVELLRRMAARIDGFAADNCPDCIELKQSVLQLVTLLEQVKQDNGFDRRQYQAGLLQLTGHLKAKHRLVESGANLVQWMMMGLLFGVGASFGASFVRPAYIGICLGLGLCLGIAVGSAWDAKAKREGRVL